MNSLSASKRWKVATMSRVKTKEFIRCLLGETRLKKTSESRCLFLWWNSSSIRCLQAVKKMSNTHAHKEHQNGTLISRSIKKIRTIWSVGKFRPLSSYRPLVAPRPSRASPKNSPGPHSAMSTPCDSTSAVPWWIITSFFGHADTAQGATFWVTHIDIQGTYRLSWWSIYIIS